MTGNEQQQNYIEQPKLKKMITQDDLRDRLEEMSQRVLIPNEGVFGPNSMAWRINKHTSVMMGAGAANLLQLAHPWVAQAIDQHSQTQTDPLGRLRRTFINVHSMVFGNLDQVLNSSVRVHNIHAAIAGKASETTGSTHKGTDYFANQVGAMMWVYATLWVTGCRVHELFYGPLSKQEQDQFHEEGKMFAYLFGIPEDVIPETWGDFLEYYNAMVDSDILAVGDVGKQLVEYIFSMRAYLVPLLNRHKIHTAVLLPERLREDFGFPPVDTKTQSSFDFDVKLARNIFKVSPMHLKYLPPYIEATKRLTNENTTMVTRFTNRIIYGQPTLVS